MKRYARGAVLLVAAVGLASCSGDPLDPGTPARVVADPQIIFVDQGATTITDIRVIDDLGNALDMPDFSVEAQTGDVSVAVDSNFRSVFDANGNRIPNPQETNVRLNVTGVGLAKTGVIVSARGVTDTIPVVVTPTVLAATFSTNAPSVGAPVTITAPAGLKFTAGSGVTDALGATPVGGVDAFVGVSADGTTLTYIPDPGYSGPITISGVSPSYAPALNVSLTTTDSIKVAADTAAITPISGTNDPATAPTILTPASGQTVALFDTGTWGWAGLGASNLAQVYTLNVPEDGTYDFTLDWNNDSDLGVYLADGTAIADAGGVGGRPESDSIDLAAGTYQIAIIWFNYAGSTVPPTAFQLKVGQE